MYQRTDRETQRKLDFLATDLDDGPETPTALRLTFGGATITCSDAEAMKLLTQLGRDYCRLRNLEQAICDVVK